MENKQSALILPPDEKVILEKELISKINGTTILAVKLY